LNYLMVTIPDITFAISVVSQCLSTPKTTHLEAVMKIVIPEKSSSERVLYSDHGHTIIAGFSDADWAECPFDRRSTTRYCVFLGENLVSWKRKKQSVVSQSNAESEYMAMGNVILELVWIQRLIIPKVSHETIW